MSVLGRLVDKSASVVALPSLKTNSRGRKIDGSRRRTFGGFFKCPRARLQANIRRDRLALPR
jgi:hypothetical protein